MLNLYEILQKVLNESISSNDVIDVINNHNYVDVNYVDDEGRAVGRRLIQPYAYGLSMAGNEVIRVFQMSGDSFKGQPGWKTMRLDRITYWHPRKQTFKTPPPMQGYNVPNYNDLGDGSMSKVFLLAKFDNLSDTLGQEKAKTQAIQNAPKLSKKNVEGPIPYASQQWKKNVYTSQPGSKKYAQWAKNVDDTANEFNRFDDDVWAKAEAEKQQQNNIMLQNTISKPKQTKQGPIDINNKKDLKDDQ